MLIQVITTHSPGMKEKKDGLNSMIEEPLSSQRKKYLKKLMEIKTQHKTHVVCFTENIV